MNDNLGIIIGAIIGFLSAFLSTFFLDYFRARRELKKWKLESTTEFFRGLYKEITPFFSAYYQIMYSLMELIVREIGNLTKEESEQIISNLDVILKKYSDAHQKFIDEGYIGLFPKDLGGMLLTFEVKVRHLNELVKDKGIANKKTAKTIEETLSKGSEIRDRMRQLLNVDALG